MIDWEDIASRYGPLVWRTIYRLLGGGGARATQAAQDCFQETFLTALDYARRNEVKNWPGLLQRIATTRALDALNRRRDAQRRVRGDGGDVLDSVPAAANGQPDAAMLEDEAMQQFRVALAELPPGQREVFCLRHLSEMSYEEIAEQTGISVDAVGVALHRARARLRAALAGAIDPNPARPVNPVRSMPAAEPSPGVGT
jgi:RNA polymerase sigma-70 factor (ECF subfamily)